MKQPNEERIAAGSLVPTTTTTTTTTNTTVAPTTTTCTTSSIDDDHHQKPTTTITTNTNTTTTERAKNRKTRTGIGPFDVLLGRGSPSIHNRGNIYFRHIVQLQKLNYKRAKKLKDKNVIAELIVQHIYAENGAFLRKEVGAGSAGGNSSTSTECRWVEVGHRHCLDKTKQALRDPFVRDQHMQTNEWGGDQQQQGPSLEEYTTWPANQQAGELLQYQYHQRIQAAAEDSFFLFLQQTKQKQEAERQQSLVLHHLLNQRQPHSFFRHDIPCSAERGFRAAGGAGCSAANLMSYSPPSAILGSIGDGLPSLSVPAASSYAFHYGNVLPRPAPPLLHTTSPPPPGAGPRPPAGQEVDRYSRNFIGEAGGSTHPQQQAASIKELFQWKMKMLHDRGCCGLDAVTTARTPSSMIIPPVPTSGTTTTMSDFPGGNKKGRRQSNGWRFM